MGLNQALSKKLGTFAHSHGDRLIKYESNGSFLVLGRLRVKTRKRVHGFLTRFTRKPIHFLWGLRVLHVSRNLQVFTRKTRNLPSSNLKIKKTKKKKISEQKEEAIQ